jgi:hypothetical protein
MSAQSMYKTTFEPKRPNVQSTSSFQSKTSVHSTSTSIADRSMVSSNSYGSDTMTTYASLREYLNNIIKRADIEESLDLTLDETIRSMFISEEVFERIAETFPSLKMEYDNGKIKIIELQGQGHRTVISDMSRQLGIFCDLYYPHIFRNGGGLTPIYVYGKDGFDTKLQQKADPDEALKHCELGKPFIRLIFEVEIHNRSFNELDRRMKFLMVGWRECYIGIACKFFAREVDGGVFQGVLFVYYKIEGEVIIHRICDIGTTALSVARTSMLEKTVGDVRLESPNSRCTVIRHEIKNRIFEEIETSEPDFYRIEVDSNLLYHGTLLQDEVNQQALVIDFFQILRDLHHVKSKSFAGDKQPES